MVLQNEKTHEVIRLPEPNLRNPSCTTCGSRDIIRANSYLRRVKELGTKRMKKFVEFESIHLKCNSCDAIFPLERDEFEPGLSVTRDVLDTVLTLYFDFKHSAKIVGKLMNSLYSVKLKRGTILNWVRNYGKEYCRKSQIVFKENFEKTSGHYGMDGTFPKFNFILNLLNKSKPWSPESPFTLKKATVSR
ncbi:MAG: hypothetical protein ACTSRG_26625 [Candidatus Helarchaeota archaeon]